MAVLWVAEKAESLPGIAEDKEAAEHESKKLPEKEVSPVFLLLLLFFLSCSRSAEPPQETR